MKTTFILAAIIAGALLAAPAAATHGILLVSDQVDGVSQPQLFDEYYEKAIGDAGYTFASWDHSTRGQPTYEDLRPYKVIIWYTSTSGQAPASDPLRGSLTLSAAEQDVLAQYLAYTPGTTTVMLSGMYFGWNCVADAINERQYYKPLFSDFLKLNYPHDNFDKWIKVDDDWKLQSESGCKIFKNSPTYSLTWRHRTTYPDQLEPGAGGAAEAWWVDPSSHKHHRAVIRAEGTKANGGRYKVVLFACPFENILGEEKRKEVMENFLNWAGVEGDIGITPASLGRLKILYR